MYNCLNGIRKYYSMKSCYDIELLEDKKPTIIWYLKNGTIVKANNIEIISNILKKEILLVDYYWSTQITDTLWEVQFSKLPDPDVKVIVTADNGLEAGTIAKTMIHKDCDTIEIIDLNIL